LIRLRDGDGVRRTPFRRQAVSICLWEQLTSSDFVRFARMPTIHPTLPTAVIELQVDRQ
jgi:hypothetical protein